MESKDIGSRGWLRGLLDDMACFKKAFKEMNCHTAWQTNAWLELEYGVKDGDGVAKREEVQS